MPRRSSRPARDSADRWARVTVIRLAWSFVFQRPPDDARWEVLVDAHDGEVIAFQDRNQYVARTIKGGVYPLTSTGICPNADQCGIMQSQWPMPFADTGLQAPNAFTNSGGVYNWSPLATPTTTLTGKYVKIADTCGPISNGGRGGNINLGGTNGQHDCTAGGGSLGNTPASRSAFYEVNKLGGPEPDGGSLQHGQPDGVHHRQPALLPRQRQHR